MKRAFEVVKDKFRKFPYKEINLPHRSTMFSAGYDFYSNEDVVIDPNKSYAFYTDVKAHMMSNEVLQIHVRSSIGINRNLMLSNGTGIIDSDYVNNISNDGGIIICLYNYGTESQEIKEGERIAQGIFVNYRIVDEDTTKLGREGGIGSTN